jgi:hypothetical protein
MALGANLAILAIPATRPLPPFIIPPAPVVRITIAL